MSDCNDNEGRPAEKGAANDEEWWLEDDEETRIVEKIEGPSEKKGLFSLFADATKSMLWGDNRGECNEYQEREFTEEEKILQDPLHYHATKYLEELADELPADKKLPPEDAKKLTALCGMAREFQEKVNLPEEGAEIIEGPHVIYEHGIGYKFGRQLRLLGTETTEILPEDVKKAVQFCDDQGVPDSLSAPTVPHDAGKRISSEPER